MKPVKMAERDFTHAKDVGTPSMPRMGNALTRLIGRGIMRVMGWRFQGKLPDEPKVIFIGAPHTSNWDLIIALSCMMAVGLRCSWMMKKQAFFWPVGSLWKAMGGIPIDRSARMNVTEQMTEWFKANDTAWLGITPEGTRSKVTEYKKGYLRMANAANVPVFIIAINAPEKRVVLDQLWPLTGDIEADNASIKAYYDAHYIGINPEKG